VGAFVPDRLAFDDRAPHSGEAPPAVPAPPVVVSGLNARRAVALLLAYILAQLAIGLVVGVVFGVYFALDHIAPAQLAKRLQSPTVLLSAGTLGILGATLLVVSMTRRFFRGIPRSDAFRVLGLSRASPQDFVIAAVLGISLAVLYVLVATKFVPPGQGQPAGPLARAAASGGFSRVLWAVLAVLIAPPIEEFLFRGALFAGFEKTWGRATAILLVTVTFVLLHLSETRSYWPALVAIAIMALALAAVRVRSGSIGPAIMLHAYYNLGLVLIVFASSSHS
jgi:membrane protease YdiL (CAAX protease family)